jgi:hypothetical protein
MRGTVSIASEVDRRVKIIHEGEPVDAEEIDFKAISEAAGNYQLSDGASIELIHTIKRIYRLCDKKKADGSPLYIVAGEAKLIVTQPRKAPEENP